MKPDERRRRAVAASRRPITWQQLNAICRSTVTDDPSVSEWQGRIVDRILDLGFALPEPATLHRAIDRNRMLLPPALPPHFTRPTRAEAEIGEMAHEDPTRIPRLGPAPGGLSAVAAAMGRATRTESACGCLKRISGRKPLVCTRAAGHEGDHWIALSPVLPPFVRWARSDAD